MDEMKEARMQDFRDDLSDAIHDQIDGVVRIDTFDEVGMLTQDEGLVVTMADGSEYQITIVKSR